MQIKVLDSKLNESVLDWICAQDNFGIIVTDANLKIVQINKWFNKHLNISSDKAANRSLVEVFPEISERGIDSYYMRSLLGSPSILSNRLHKHLVKIPFNDIEHNVEFMYQSSEIYPLYSDNKVVGTLTRIFDVTDRVVREKELTSMITDLMDTQSKLKESEKHFKDLADNLPDVIARFDKELKHLYINEKMREVTNFSPSDYIGKTNKELGMPDDLTKLWNDAIKNTFESKLPNSFQFALPQNDKIEYFESRLIPEFSDNGDVDSVLGINRNITLQKEANEKLDQYNKELQELNANKDKLFSILAHDLRSPFNPLINLSELMLEDFNSLTKEEHLLYLKEFNLIVNNIYKLLENLLSWAQFQKGRIAFNPKEFDFIESLNSSLVLLTKNAAEKQISLSVTYPPGIIIQADPDMIKVLIRNLISNAIKFTPVAGEISLTAQVIDDNVEFIVKDSGVGMPADIVNNIFNIASINSTRGTSGEKGSGLGLILCKEIVDKHHGSIKIKSELNKGTAIQCLIPLFI